MTIRLQQLFRSSQRKIDNLAETRLRLARCLREQRMGEKAVRQVLEEMKK